MEDIFIIARTCILADFFNTIRILTTRYFVIKRFDREKGTSETVTGGPGGAVRPQISHDGKTLVYVTWNDSTSGAIYKINMQGTAKPVRMTTEKSIYRMPSFSNDGKRVVYRKEGSNDVLGPAFTAKPGIYTISSNGGETNFVNDRGDLPTFNKNGDRIFYQVGGGMNRTYASSKLDGSDERVHLKSTYRILPSYEPSHSHLQLQDNGLHQSE